MIWWWNPFMALFEMMLGNQSENAEGAVDQNDKREQANGRKRSKAAKVRRRAETTRRKAVSSSAARRLARKKTPRR
jgi:hypothetical protein